ncbi:MAG: bifunctional 4-hydroxy-2-oxoglutarate aldolase/2-dehydro-3-deoxy-phosphogluconate aldolase [Abditibacteriales bacterium]|nr:bifunctional 4-hydroxy-2-oxoglutarate aldolase/2-dehydro-3-deoxy-phosphogluconate aldolase [Abditibacteriales bacterium]MDW8366496.1 bifunctional 4-hydroxy-2-oxoglutarate aldolase/2-dehydro-3-deoxy-phosphogluconate aldolase [Abditibacteriales bacterium]
MTKQEALQCVRQHKLFAIIRTATALQAEQAAQACYAGGIRLIEITWTVAGAAEALRATQRKLDDALIGAGSIVNVEMAKDALDAGAQFIVGPNTSAEVLALCRERDVFACAGAMTPTEIVHAYELGSDIVKVFPAGPLGGPAYIKAVREPLPFIPLMPTGGVNLDNMLDYLRVGAVALGIGGTLIDKAAIAEGRWDVIEAKVREHVERLKLL